MIRFKIVLVLLVFTLACSYDNEEDLFSPAECITENVKFSTDIISIMNRHCIGCHNDFARQGNVVLASYSDVVSYVGNGSLLGSIRHESGWSPMPKDGRMITDCEIRKIEQWIQDGSPNN